MNAVQILFDSKAAIADHRTELSISVLNMLAPDVLLEQPHSLALTSLEEVVLLRAHESQLMCALRNSNMQFSCCAINNSYCLLKNFYMSNSFMNTHPRKTCICSAWIGCKTSMPHIDFEDFAAAMEGQQNSIARSVREYQSSMEMDLSSMTNFECVFCRMNQIMQHMRRNDPNINVTPLVDNAYQFLNGQLLTDAMLLYTPQQIAVASVAFAMRKNNQSALWQFLIQNYARLWQYDAKKMTNDFGDIIDMVLGVHNNLQMVHDKLPNVLIKLKRFFDLIFRIAHIPETMNVASSANGMGDGLRNDDVTLENLY